MLIVERKLGEQIVVPVCEMTVTVLGVAGKKVRLGVDAPPGVTVHRKEVLDRITRQHRGEQTAPVAREERLMSVRVLLADPDDYLLDYYRRSLERQGVAVITATTGLECMERLRDSAPDLLVMDPALPWGWGDGVLALMHEDADVPLIPVIVLTDGRDHSLLYRLARFHLDGYQVKPVGAKQLVEQIRVVVMCQRAAETSAGGIP